MSGRRRSTPRASEDAHGCGGTGFYGPNFDLRPEREARVPLGQRDRGLEIGGALAPRFGLRTARAPMLKHTVTMKLCWHERTHADPAMVAFRDLVRRALRGRAARTFRSARV